ncbi:MFS transporter [Ktedonosporobacter rubrisoli]|uniref:MFS transporter n=1 Tax=Ktedonosporobacter rubrisoli TaxID=2509675 RepID=A0A4P6JQ14_KTERU|nr:MFS transporter [Ktedonosporobacter rubrisoli]QBD76856.1 MFS transporter [Ktedonosporobacter rubrisoli]
MEEEIIRSPEVLSQTLNAADDVITDVPEALRPPTKPVGLGLPAGIAIATVSWLAVGLPILSLLLPEQINRLDPIHKVATLGIILTLGGLAGVISPPLGGALSDRTTARIGRRRPWILGGMLGVVAGLLLASQANTILFIAIGWIVINCCGNLLLAILNILMPDRIPEKERGTASAIIGLALPISTVLGMLLVTTVLNLTGQSIPIAYSALIAIIILLAGGFVLFYREPRLPKGAMPPFRLGEFVAGFWISPRQFPDFAYAWITRFLVFLAFFTISSFSNFFLRDVVHYAQLFPGHTVAEGMTIVTTISTVGSLVATLLGGIISDRFQRRKPFVIGATVLLALSLLIPALIHTWPAVIVSFALQGIGIGAYNAVDMALITQVLPRAESRGKDLGVMVIALNVAQFLAPSVGALAISIFASSVEAGYTSLFLVATVLTLLGAVLVQPIKSVR